MKKFLILFIFVFFNSTIAWSDSHNTKFKDIKGFKKQFISMSEKKVNSCLLYTSPSPRDTDKSRMPSSA